MNEHKRAIILFFISCLISGSYSVLQFLFKQISLIFFTQNQFTISVKDYKINIETNFVRNTGKNNNMMF